MFSKTTLSCWEHMLISLLGYDPIHTVESMAESSLLPRSQKVCFSANYKWSLRRFDGLGLCQVTDRTLVKKAVYIVEKKLRLLNSSQTLFERLIKKKKKVLRVQIERIAGLI